MKCIERELDLINISVVSEGFSELLSQKLQEARRKGIACIVAAGNSAARSHSRRRCPECWRSLQSQAQGIPR